MGQIQGSGCPCPCGSPTPTSSLPAILEALTKRVAHGIFGYSRPSPRLIELIVSRGWPAAMAGPSSPNGSSSCPGWCRASISPARPGASTGAASSPQAGLLSPSCRRRASMTAPCSPSMVVEEGRWVLDLEELERQAPRRICCCCATPQPGRHRLHPGRAAGHRRHRRAPQPGDLLRTKSTATCCWTRMPATSPMVPWSPEAAERSAVAMAPSKTFNIAGCAAPSP